MIKRYKLTLGYLFILFVFAFSCRPEGEIVRANLQNFSVTDQAKIGSELAKHISKSPNTYNLYRPAQNEQIYAYLNNVLNTIVNTQTVVNREAFNWDIFIIRDEESMSAFTLPGGKLYITSAFLKFIKSEAQLISVLGHEMCYADHNIAMSKLQENHSGLILGDIIFNNPVDELDEIIGTLMTEEFSANEVQQADLYSVDLLCPFNYEADGIFTLLRNISDEDYPLEWELTRPSYNGRMDTISTRASVCGIATIEETRYIDNVINLLD